MKIFTENEADEIICRARRHQLDKTSTKILTSNVFQSCDKLFYNRSDSDYWKEAGTAISHANKVRHGRVYVLVNPHQMELLSESEKAENVGTNEVETNFQKSTEIAEPKIKISSNTNINHTIDEMFGIIKSVSNESCPKEEQPTEDDESTLSDMLD